MVQYYYGTGYSGETTAPAPGYNNPPPAAGNPPPPQAGANPPPPQAGGNPPPPQGNPPPPQAGNPPPANGHDGGDHNGGLLDGLLGGGLLGGGLLGGNLLGGNLVPGALADTLNGIIHDFHDSIETSAHDIGLAHTVHGVTHLGEAIGLGEIGGNNLLTDVLEAPSDILNGNTGGLINDLVQDTAQILDASGNLVKGVGTDLSNHDGILDVVDTVIDLAGGVGGVGGGGGNGDVGLLGILNTTPHGAGNSSHNHLLEANVGDLGTGLSLGELNILDGGSIQVPLAQGFDADALTGLAHGGSLTALLPIGGGEGSVLPEIGSITSLLPEVLDHNDGHFLLG